MRQRRIPRTELGEIRRQFARMLDEGVPAKSIMVALKLSRTTYFEWKKAYQERGLDGLKVRPLPGAAPKLTDRQTSQLCGCWSVVTRGSSSLTSHCGPERSFASSFACSSVSR